MSSPTVLGVKTTCSEEHAVEQRLLAEKQVKALQQQRLQSKTDLGRLVQRGHYAKVQVRFRKVLAVYNFEPVVLITVPFAAGAFAFLLAAQLGAIWAAVVVGFVVTSVFAMVLASLLYFPNSAKLKQWLEEFSESKRVLEKQVGQLDETLRVAKAQLEALIQQGEAVANVSAIGEVESTPIDLADGVVQAEGQKEYRLAPSARGGLDLVPVSVSQKPATIRSTEAQRDWRAMRTMEFGLFVEKIFRDLGYKVQRTPAGEGQGVDLIVYHTSQRIAVQTCGSKGAIKNQVVQEVYAGMAFYKCNSCAVISSSLYSAEARSLARSTQCLLVGELEMQRFMDGKVFPRLVSAETNRQH